MCKKDHVRKKDLDEVVNFWPMKAKWGKWISFACKVMEGAMLWSIMTEEQLIAL